MGSGVDACHERPHETLVVAPAGRRVCAVVVALAGVREPFSTHPRLSSPCDDSAGPWCRLALLGGGRWLLLPSALGWGLRVMFGLGRVSGAARRRRFRRRPVVGGRARCRWWRWRWRLSRGRERGEVLRGQGRDGRQGGGGAPGARGAALVGVGLGLAGSLLGRLPGAALPSPHSVALSAFIAVGLALAAFVVVVRRRAAAASLLLGGAACGSHVPKLPASAALARPGDPGSHGHRQIAAEQPGG